MELTTKSRLICSFCYITYNFYVFVFINRECALTQYSFWHTPPSNLIYPARYNIITGRLIRNAWLQNVTRKTEIINLQISSGRNTKANKNSAGMKYYLELPSATAVILTSTWPLLLTLKFLPWALEVSLTVAPGARAWDGLGWWPWSAEFKR